MALLRIPDKYAQERGGWKSDKVMKKVYMQTFTEEREKVDNIIDTYFNGIIESGDGGEDEFDVDKYKAYLMLFDKEDVEQSRIDFSLFIQHEMQHKRKKSL